MKDEKRSKSITVPDIISRKSTKEKIAVITAYDFTFARLFDAAGIDIVLVGDSLSSVIQGHKNTLPVTMDEIVYHTKCVTAGLSRALCVADMPFMSYQPSKEKALEAAGRLIKEGGAAAVKLEGGLPVAEIIEHIVSFDIPVMGHVGLTPQSYHRMGGHKVQGKNHGISGLMAGSAERIIEDALAIEKAGAFAVVIECVPGELAEEITNKLSIPTIGIGAGRKCDGQVLVMHDLLGLEDRRQPKFVKRYAQLAGQVKNAAEKYIEEVRGSKYPGDEHTFDDDAYTKSDSKVKQKKTKLKLV